MQGKTRSFLEDTVILIVVVVIAYGSYALYDYFSQSDNQSTQTIVKETNESNVVDNNDTNATKNLEESTTEIVHPPKMKEVNESSIKDEKEVKKKSLVNTEIKEAKKLIKKEPIKNTVKEKTIQEEKKTTTKVVKKEALKNIVEIKKEPIKQTIISTNQTKDIDLAILRKFIKDLKFKVATNLEKRDDIDSSISQKLKIRITVLPNGNFEQLTFISGDKELFQKNEENIQKIFPVKIDERIKADFPRYVRLTIK